MKLSRLQLMTGLAVWGLALVLAVPCVLGQESDLGGSEASTPGSDTPSAMEVAYDYRALYERLSGSIVKVEVDSGSGSGFVVDSRGLIATNYHVVQNTRFLAVQFPDSVLARAEIVKLSARYDLAILKVHPKFVEGVPPLKLVSPEKENDVKAGLPVVAFGSPLSQTFLATQGIVSKVEDVALLGDFLLEPGNSGGPLVNLDGEVIGVNTFGLQGIAGAVRVSYLRKLLDGLDADQLLDVEVSDQPLRTLSLKRYPVELLKAKVTSGRFDIKDYQYTTGALNSGKFQVTVLTPVSLARFAVRDEMQQAENRYKRRGRKIHDPSYRAMDELFYEWHRNVAASLDLGVTFRIQPQVGLTTGSLIGSAIWAGLGVYNTQQNFEFKGEFYDFKVFRDGQLIEPVRPGRQIMENTLDGPLAKFVDEAYAGVYIYAPEEFMTGDEFRFVIYNARTSSQAHHSKTLKATSKLIHQLRSDFREVLGAGARYWEDDASDSEPPGTGVFLVTGAWDEGWTNVGSEVFRTMTNEEAGIVAQKGRDGVDLIEVHPGTPAYESGLRTGDTVLSIDGRVSYPRDNVTRTLTVKYMAHILKRIRRGKIQESEWKVQHRGGERTLRVAAAEGSQ